MGTPNAKPFRSPKLLIFFIALFVAVLIITVSNANSDTLGCGNLSECKNQEKCVGPGMADGCTITCNNGTKISCPPVAQQ